LQDISGKGVRRPTTEESRGGMRNIEGKKSSPKEEERGSFKKKGKRGGP